MRRLDVGFGLLAVAFLATLGWWWTGRYDAEQEALVDRVDGEVERWRAERLRMAVADMLAGESRDADSLEVSTSLIAVGAGLKVDPERSRVIQFTNAAEAPVLPARNGANLREGLARVLEDGKLLGASAAEAASAMREIGARLGVSLRINDDDRDSASVTVTIDGHSFTGTLLVPISGAEAGTSATNGYVVIEEYRGMLLRRIAPEIGVGAALLLGLGGFYAVVRRDLRRRTRALAEKDRFIANVAHELKTPIAVVGVALEALENFGADADPARRQRYLRTSREELSRLELLAERALGTLQLEGAAAQAPRREPVDLLGLAADSWQTLALKHGFSSALGACAKTGNAAAAPAALVYGDPQLLRHLLDNLLDNAVKYGGDPAAVRVCLDVQRKTVALRIRDDGPGIPAAERARVFEKFYRVYSADEGHRVKGHGLGLSYAREIVRRHGGRILLGTGPDGAGTEVTVQFPRA